MRVLMSGLIAAGLLTSQMVAAQHCAQPRDKAAFDVMGLKSQLMVTALTCDIRERYNAFVMRFRAGLVAQDRALISYFGREFGRRATQEHDEYVTSLANVQSEAGLRFGVAFCAHEAGLFDRVMALSAPTELPGFAATQEITQPVALVACVTPERRTRTVAATTANRNPH